MLQADSEQECQDWINSIQNAVSKAYNRQSTQDNPVSNWSTQRALYVGVLVLQMAQSVIVRIRGIILKVITNVHKTSQFVMELALQIAQ